MYSLYCILHEKRNVVSIIVLLLNRLQYEKERPKGFDPQDQKTTRVKTHKLLQVCKQVVTSLFTSCQQVVFTLLVPSLL